MEGPEPAGKLLAGQLLLHYDVENNTALSH